MAFPLGNSLALQGPILIIGFLFGPAMVATFSAMRTLARIPYQITFAFSSSISPEMTFAYGARNFKLLRKLHRKSWALNTIAVSIVALTIGFFGESIVHIWLRKTIVFDALILNGLLVTTFMLSLWNSSSMVLMSSNKHSELAKYYLISNVLGFFISYTLSALTNISGLIVSLVFVEMVLLFTALPLALIVSDDSFGRFFKGMNFSQRKTQIR
jgi:O-antigen/teichoic acid export membrane protein